MGSLPHLSLGGFPFRNANDGATARVLAAALEPRAEGIDELLQTLDEALAYAARYEAAEGGLRMCETAIENFSPLALERRREFERDRRIREAGRPFEQDPARGESRARPRRPNIFAPGGDEGEAVRFGRDDPATASTTRLDATPLLAELAVARERAAADVRALRDALDPAQHKAWLRAVHDVATLLVRAGKARVTYA